MLAAVNREIADRATAGKKITPAELAHKTGIPDKTLRRRLYAETSMDPDTFEAVCIALEVTVEDMWARARHIQATEEWDATTAELLEGIPASALRETGRTDPRSSAKRPVNRRKSS